LAVGLILKFDSIGRTEYEAVNAKLGIDMASGSGDWPPGLKSHAAGTGDDGKFYVVEVWESRDAQGQFMHGRLGRALQEGGVSGMPEVTWFDLLAYQTPGG
jgi:hypothetical protein